MASIEMEGFDELIHKLEKLGDQSYVEGIAKKAVDEAAPLTEAQMKSSLASSERGPYSTGSIAASVQTTKAKVNQYGVFAVSRPTGRDVKGVRNGEKAAYLQYGTKRMAARPWRDKAVNASLGPAQVVMEQVIKQEMELD